MPIYEYQCVSCGRLHEIMQKHNDKKRVLCPSCGGSMKKLISQTSFVLKGTGWYKTDYASKDRKKAMEVKKGDSAKADKKSEKKTEKKPEPTSKK